MGKLSTEEIEIAGRAAHDAYYEEGNRLQLSRQKIIFLKGDFFEYNIF